MEIKQHTSEKPMTEVIREEIKKFRESNEIHQNLWDTEKGVQGRKL
jgi:hypothetical protein